MPDARFGLLVHISPPAAKCPSKSAATESITATAARKDLYNLIAKANDSCTSIAITTTKGKGAVLIGEDEWAAIEETLYLNGVPGTAKSILEGGAEPLSECVDAGGLEW